MDNVYALNPYPVPSKSGTPPHHTRNVISMVIIVVLAAAVGAAFLWNSYQSAQPVAQATPSPVPMTAIQILNARSAAMADLSDASSSISAIAVLQDRLPKTTASKSAADSANVVRALNARVQVQ
ncbi:hypothetical protein KGP36_06615 [Patescibacteria group bacterium]|nr:hypothetical protein [Patescibacteria group bacterium]MDE1940927.1 hypothetical protein [Patescibacteria group bacterium]